MITTNKQQIEAAELGAAWGLLEAELMIADVENGYRLRPAEWTNGQWSGYVPPGAGRYRYEAALDRAAQVAYGAAIDAAQAVQA
jgi:hypothetical protein